MTYQPPDPRLIAKRGAEIYDRLYRSDYEKKCRGRFAAIDIESEKAYLGDFPEQALDAGKRAAPTGTFYLVRIGSRAAFKTSRLASRAHNRIV
jgi:hypothetical protein